MSRKSKGINAERDLIHLFWEQNWAASRVAGSGSIKYPSPDVIAGNNVRKVAIECKVTKGRVQYFTKKEIEELQEFCKLFGAEAWVGVKFNSKGWWFMNLEDLDETDKFYVATFDVASRRGLEFLDLVKI